MGAETVNLVAAPGLSEMGAEVPEIAVLVSVAVMVWLPEVLKVVENVPMPLGKSNPPEALPLSPYR